MKRGWIFAALVIAVPLLAEEDKQAVVAHVIDNSTARTPILTVAPNYPRKARRDRIEGEVQVCFDIDRSGRPHRIAVRNSTNRAFEKPSIEAVRASSFRPLGDDELPIAIKFCRTFFFSLEPQDAENFNRADVVQ